MPQPRTIIEKVWDAHIVTEQPGAPTLIYIDLHLVHDVTSPQAFSGLRERGLKVRRPDTRKGERIQLFTTEAGAELEAWRLLSRSGEIAEVMLPRALTVLPSLPVLASGKVDYRALEAMAEQGSRAA